MFEIKLKTDLSELERLAKAFPAVSIASREAKLTEALALLERAIKKETPFGAGPLHLRDSISGKVSVQGTKVWGTVGTPLEHGEPVEMGTRPHFPPIGPIQHWVQTVLHVGDEKESKSIAFAIAKSIAKKGTEGNAMFQTGFDENEAALLRILNEIPADIIRRLNA